ncbi:SDR family oxidoreductase [Erysipelothrix urinaevulpis]|uniref:SDR family oxidoreductase n=1 Tax=Erysipelothrix urinaevulpis TaxID=2683717 RepID=UPI00135AD5F2|nr:SDR family oxidoreductase [Erysipelothrix urinaevulpis]
MKYTDLEFEKDSIFLVTGGAGFIGSHLCETILKMGYKVRCLDDLSNGFLHNIEPFMTNNNFEFIKQDIMDLDGCIAAAKDVDYILHQAAWGSVPRSIEMPVFYEQVNIGGTLNMLEAARRNNVKKFVYASSSSVYGDEPNLPKVEGREGNVLSPYALTKKVNEQYAKLYSELYNLDTYGLRYFNVFGPRQNPNGAYAAVIPKFINQLKNDEQPTINGDGQQSRDFTYIENVIDANLKACKADSKYSGEAFNIASGGREYLIDVYDTIAKELNKEHIKPIMGSDRVGDIKHSNADVSKAEEYLNYVVSVSFKEGLKSMLTKENR